MVVIIPPPPPVCCHNAAQSLLFHCAARSPIFSPSLTSKTLSITVSRIIPPLLFDRFQLILPVAGLFISPPRLNRHALRLRTCSHTALVSRYIADAKYPEIRLKTDKLVSRHRKLSLLPRRPGPEPPSLLLSYPDNSCPSLSSLPPTCRKLPTSNTRGSALPLTPAAASTAIPHRNKILSSKVSYSSSVAFYPIKSPRLVLNRCVFLPFASFYFSLAGGAKARKVPESSQKGPESCGSASTPA